MTDLPTTALGMRYDDLVEHSFGLICMHDLDGVLTWVNPAIARLLGYERSEMVGRPLADFLRTSDDVAPYLQSLLTEGECQGWFEAVTTGGESRFLQFHNAVMTADDGTRYVLGHAQDVTSLMKAERELLTARERLEQVRSANPATLAATEGQGDGAADRFMSLGLDLLSVRTVDGFFKQVNPAFSELLGYSDEELLTRPIHDFMHPEDVATSEEIVARLPRDGRRVSFEDRWICKDGSVCTLAWSATANDDGRLIYAIARDVTVDRAQRDELKRAIRIAEEALTAKSEFLANMSHEIRTPMNGIIGMTELTLDTVLTDQQREYLQMVQTSAGALLDVINSILDFSKIEAGKMELEQIDFTLWETITGALKPLALTARNKGIELLYDEGPEVPERLRGDPGRLRQALINLVGNAVKFTEEGSVSLTVNRVDSDDGKVHLGFVVTDTGIGIPEDKLDHIFGSFNQVDGSMSRRFGGTGLGLAITSGIVQMMGGRIDVSSEVGKGSTFAFEAILDEPARPAPRRTSLSGDLSGLHALVVDDNDANRQILVEFARRMEMRVEAAASGAEALAALDRAHSAGEPINLALLDCHMPEMGGFELAEQIRADGRHEDIVLVAFTAAGQPGDGARCEQLGIVSYLLKPLAPAELRDALLLTMEKGPRAQERGELVTRHSLRESRLSLKVLLAEDNRVNQQLATHVLERFGHKVRLVTTGAEALAAVRAENFDVILMDIQMPDMDGIEATQRIRAHEAETGSYTPIVAMTAHAMVGDRERFIEVGMDDYVSKPISRDRLREVLRGIGRTTPPDDESDKPQDTASHSADHAPAERSFDRSVLMERTESDAELIRTLVDVFEADCPKLLTDIEIALDAEDPEAMMRAAHTIKGALGVFGAEPSRARAERLEHTGRDGVIADGREQYAELREHVLALQGDLAELVQELGS